MLSDYYLVAGVIVGGFAVASLVSAWSDGRAPRAGMLLALTAGGLVALAILSSPTAFRIEDIPAAFFRVIGEIVN